MVNKLQVNTYKGYEASVVSSEPTNIVVDVLSPGTTKFVLKRDYHGNFALEISDNLSKIAEVSGNLRGLPDSPFRAGIVVDSNFKVKVVPTYHVNVFTGERKKAVAAHIYEGDEIRYTVSLTEPEGDELTTLIVIEDGNYAFTAFEVPEKDE